MFTENTAKHRELVPLKSLDIDDTFRLPDGEIGFRVARSAQEYSENGLYVVAVILPRPGYSGVLIYDEDTDIMVTPCDFRIQECE